MLCYQSVKLRCDPLPSLGLCEPDLAVRVSATARGPSFPATVACPTCFAGSGAAVTPCDRANRAAALVLALCWQPVLIYPACAKEIGTARERYKLSAIDVYRHAPVRSDLRRVDSCFSHRKPSAWHAHGHAKSKSAIRKTALQAHGIPYFTFQFHVLFAILACKAFLTWPFADSGRSCDLQFYSVLGAMYPFRTSACNAALKLAGGRA